MVNDFARAERLFRRFPKVAARGLQAGVRKSAQPVKRTVQNATKGAGWPSRFKYTRNSKSLNLHSVVIRRMNRLKPGEYGVRVIARHMGPASLMEYGSTSRRRPVSAKRLAFRDKSGKWIYPRSVRGMRPKPAWKRAEHQVTGGRTLKEVEEIIMSELMRQLEGEASRVGLRSI